MPIKYLHVLVAFLFLLSSCNYRRPSDSRFTKATHIKLPEGHTVIRDEYLEAGKDYTLQYDVQLDEQGMSSFTNDIRASENFSELPVEKNNTWIPSERGYFFFLAKDGTSYTIEVDTVSKRIAYNEAG